MDIKVKRPLNELSAADIAATIADGKTTCEAVVRDCLEHIAARDKIVKAFVNPLVSWVWFGVIIMIFGTGLALVPNAATVRATVPAAAPVPVLDQKGMHPVGAGE